LGLCEHAGWIPATLLTVDGVYGRLTMLLCSLALLSVGHRKEVSHTIGFLFRKGDPCKTRDQGRPLDQAG
jgi:hypothetical protein